MAKYRGHSSAAQYMGAWSYFWLSVLYAIPLIGLIFLIVHACTPDHENRCHYARSYFCSLIVLLIICAIIFAIYGIAYLAGGTEITARMQEMWGKIVEGVKSIGK